MTVPEVLARYFPRRVVIGLHRIESFYQQFDPGDLNGFNAIRLFRGVDSSKCKPPPWWDELPAMYGCNESHKAVIARALSDGVENALIMEDDCRFFWNAAGVITEFMEQVPANWDAIMFGGQVSVQDGKTEPVSERVSTCVQVERLHCYALTRRGMQTFYDALCEPGNCKPNDYRFGDLQEQGKLITYRCEPFVAYQAEGQSSISGRVEANRVWDDRVNVRLRDPLNIPVVALVCPFDVMEKLRDRAIIANGGESPPYMGKITPGRVEQGERTIADLMFTTFSEDPDRASEIVWVLQCDTAFHRNAVLVLWHPEKIIPYPNTHAVIIAETYEQALDALRKRCATAPE